MPQETIIIKFNPEGHPKLIAALNNLAMAQRKVMASSASVAKTTGITTAATTKTTIAMGANAKASGVLDARNKRLAKTNTFLANTFATLRSKMLLAAFAMTLVIRPITRLIKNTAKIESMGKAFDTLSGKVGGSKLAFDRLRAATNNTMKEVDLFKQANNAMILGVTKNSEEMAEMFDIAQRLGRALGQDTAMSVESLITGIGRQSRLMLDNIGIIVKTEEAYKAHADVLGINADQLTDAQKKQAFFNATMESARSKVRQLGDEQLTTSDTLQQLGTAFSDVGKELGILLTNIFKPLLTFLVEDTKRLTEFLQILRGYEPADIDPFIGFRESLPKDKAALQSLLVELESQLPKIAKPIEEATKNITTQQAEVLTLARFYENMGVTAKGAGADAAQQFRDIIEPMGTMRQNLRLMAETDIIAMELAAKSLGVEMADLPDIGDTFAAISETGLPLTEQADIVSILINKYKQAAEQQKEIAKANEDTAVSYEILGVNMDDNIDLISQAASQYGTGTRLIIDVSNDLGAAIKEGVTPSMNEFGETMPTIDANTLALIEKIRILKEQLAGLKVVTDETTGGFTEFWEKNQEGAELLVSGFSNMTSAIKGELDARIKNEMETLKASSQYQRAMARGDKDAMEKMEKDKMATFAKARKRIWHMEKAASFAEAGINIATAYTKALAQGGGLFGIPLATLVAGLGAIQLGFIAATQPPKFAAGGMIGGSRHSQGGTMIEAEQGEFVMNRDAVSAVGVENLNRMNQGGGGGGINVSISGNVMSQDFVENELSEQIKEAVRRGTDFGLS